MMVQYIVDQDPSNSLDLYLREIRDDALLSAAEERTLAEAIALGDKAARARMIQSNLRLVVRITRDYRGRGLAMDDLIGEGNLGLIRASEEFDPRFGTRFSTYASYWIKQAILHALTNTTATIRLPAHMVNLLSKWRRVERALRREFDQAPGHDQIALVLGLSDAQRVLVDRALCAGRLRREEGGLEDDAWSPDEVAGQSEAPDAPLEADDERRSLLRRLERLNDRERAIVSLRFGLEGGSPLTLKEVGHRLGVTREWVRKIEIRAVQKLDDGQDPDVPAARHRKGGPNRARATALPSRGNPVPKRSLKTA